MTEMTNGIATAETGPSVKKAKPRTGAARPGGKKRAPKRNAAGAKLARSSRKAPKRGDRKTPKHWSATHAQLVMHATPELVKRLDRKLGALAKRLRCKPSRGSVIRALVEKATA